MCVEYLYLSSSQALENNAAERDLMVRHNNSVDKKGDPVEIDISDNIEGFESIEVIQDDRPDPVLCFLHGWLCLPRHSLCSYLA